MKPTQELLQKYARLIVHTGANVQPGQKVDLNIAVDQHPFAQELIRACYEAGAALVSVDWTFAEKEKLDYAYAAQETLSTVLPWQEEKMRQMVTDLPCRIVIMSEDPDALSQADPEKVTAVARARRSVMKPYRNQMDGKYQWVIAAVPSPAWAKKCFPALDEDAAVEKLWQAIFDCVYLTEDGDPVAVWAENVRRIQEKCDWLNSQHFTSLRYTSANGTDFTVELIPDALWEGAGTRNPRNGVYYVPNLPTEEIFTSPMAGKCEGTLVSTKPLSWNSQLIDHFSITFEDGRAVRCHAEQGQETLEQMLHLDATAGMLGEVALVPKESPVNRQGFLFYNTLFDENACCHCAVGMGFKEVLPDGDNLTVEQAQARGINDSIIHVDFMIGSDDLSIIGTRADGSSAPIFVNGTWAE